MKVQFILSIALACGLVSTGCKSNSGMQTGTGGTAGQTGGSASGGATPSSGGGTTGSGGTSQANGGAGGGATCSDTTNVAPCGGDVTGTWTVSSGCFQPSGQFDLSNFGIGCSSATVTGGALQVKGSWTATADHKFTDGTTTTGQVQFSLDAKCLEISGTKTNCQSMNGSLTSLGFDSVDCQASSSGGCNCKGTANQPGGLGVLSSDPQKSGVVTLSSNTLTYPDEIKYSYCVSGSKMTWTPQGTSPALAGTVVLQKSDGGSGGSPGQGGTTGPGSGGRSGQGGTSGRDAGPPRDGPIGNGGAAGGRSGGTSGGGSSGASGGTTGTGTRGDGPCDVYAAASTPCVVAYSMVRALSKSYTGALYQVRSGSSSKNTGTGGTTMDIGMTPDGYADTASQDTFCSGTTCTVSLLYDQSGNGNNIGAAPKGNTSGGSTGAEDDYESSATKGAVTAGGHKVYSLYMAAHEGYRTKVGVKGKNMPTGTSPQGIYELADGTHYGTACCWDFGNVTTDPTKYGFMDTLFFGVAYWGKGEGAGPWMMADFEGGVWAGGAKKGDPGWGALNDDHPVNPANPSLKVPFALGFLKVSSNKWALRMADSQTATDLTTAYEGGIGVTVNNLGGIVLGVGGDNSNNSYGTFYEGAIVAGYPTNDTDLAVLKNIKAVGYSK